MDDAELVGGVLFLVDNPRSVSRILSDLLRAPVSNPEMARQAGLEPELVQVLRTNFRQTTPEQIDKLCGEGAAWVIGRRSAPIQYSWELVASLPTEVKLPEGLRRTTAETLVSIVNGAQDTLRLTAPFVDQTALRFLTNAIVSATSRSVEVELFSPTRSSNAPEAITELLAHIRSEGNQYHFRVIAYREDAPWAHLKVLTADSVIAYIGSANVTGPALTGANLELGVLVRGQQVRTIEAFLDLFRSQH